MKIAIVAPSPIPFAPGGAESVWAGLYRELAWNSAHDVELIKVPVRERTLPEVMAGYEEFTRLDLAHFDQVITGKYPAWMISHPNHVVYLLHPLRGLYDSYSTFGLPITESCTEPAILQMVQAAGELQVPGQLPGLFALWRATLAQLGADHPSLAHPGPLGRMLVRAMDRMALAPGAVKRHFAISRTVARRPDYFPPGVTGTVVYPPSDLQGLREAPGEFFFTTSRHDVPKRLDLLIRAMEFYPGNRQLVIGGGGPETEHLQRLAAGDPRIRFVGRLSPDDLVDHYARAIGVPFIPFDEDLGLITIEAMAAGKPVLTSYDSGGPTEFVVAGRNGVIVDPTPEALGAGFTALERLASTPAVADAARRAVSQITWQRVASELVAQPEPVVHRRPGSGRPRLVVTSTFPIWPPRGGGQLRAYHLYGALSRTFDVDLICLANPFVPPSVRELRPGMMEYVIPRTAEHGDEEARLSAPAGFPVTDIVAGRLITSTPHYLTVLGDAVAEADAVLLADPFLNPAVRLVNRGLPIIYDAYNCEYVLKSQMLPESAAGDALRLEVLDVEGQACRDAGLITTVSDQDAASLAQYYDMPADRFLLVPNGVNLEDVPFTPMTQRQHNRARWVDRLHATGGQPGIESVATFVGSWHSPNNAAGRAIVKMAPELPQVAFLLMGGHCATLEDLELPPNVFLLGIVSDAVKQTVLRTADVALAPLMSGSGTNLKVVEYMAAGIPLVSTPVGMRGLDIEPGLTRVAALTDFPGAIAAELADRDGAAFRTEAARALVEQHYGWTALGDRAAERIEQLLASTRHSPSPVKLSR